MSSRRDKILADLVARHGAPLEKYLARKLENPEDAAEVAQETYLRLHRLEQLENLDNARAYLFQMATNLAVDQLRRRTLHNRYIAAEKSQVEGGETSAVNSDGISPEKILVAREKLATINAALDELPFKVKQAFLLHRRSGMSYSSIAQQMQVSVSSVEKYILQALKHCRNKLGQ